MKRGIEAFFLFLFIFLSAVCCWAGQSSWIPASADLIWVDYEGGGSTVYHSEAKEGRWRAPEKVAASGSGRITTPAIVRDRHNNLLAFWSVVQGDQSLLYVSREKDRNWTEPKLIPTGMVFAGGACPVVDKRGGLWLFWVGNNGASDDDIFSSRWDGETWSKPLRVNRGNNSPDIFPVAGTTATGMPWVVWSGFDGSSYRRFFSIWTGTHWQKQQPLTGDNPLLKVCRQRFVRKIKLPVTVTRKELAYIDIHDHETTLHSFRIMFQR